MAAAALVRNGYNVFFNMAFTGPVDLIAEKGNKLFKVQVKTFFRRKKKNVLVADLRTCESKGKHRTYEDLCDLLLLVDCDSGEVFLPPIGVQKTQINKQVAMNYLIFPIK